MKVIFNWFKKISIKNESSEAQDSTGKNCNPGCPVVDHNEGTQGENLFKNKTPGFSDC